MSSLFDRVIETSCQAWARHVGISHHRRYHARDLGRAGLGLGSARPQAYLKIPSKGARTTGEGYSRLTIAP